MRESWEQVEGVGVHASQDGSLTIIKPKMGNRIVSVQSYILKHMSYRCLLVRGATPNHVPLIYIYGRLIKISDQVRHIYLTGARKL